MTRGQARRYRRRLRRSMRRAEVYTRNYQIHYPGGVMTVYRPERKP